MANVVQVEAALVVSSRGREPVWWRFLRRPLGVAGAAWLIIVLIGAAFAPLLAPYNSQTQDLASSLSGPSASHVLGTDQLGRDVLSWLLYGAGPTLLGVAAAVVTCVVVGVTLGVLAGYAGGRADVGITRFADLVLSIPALVVLLVIFSVFRDTLLVPMAVLGFLFSAGLMRVVRGVTLSVREELYIRAARVAGLSHVRIVVRHVLPRISSTVVVQAALFAGLALIIQNGLAYLGFGIVPPAPSWGGLIAEAAQVVEHSPWMLVPSGGTLGLTVLAFVFVGNAVRDVTTEGWAGGRQQKRTKRPKTTSNPMLRATGGTARSAALLNVEHLTVTFSQSVGPVVTDVTFTIDRGESVALLGESGCGKTITALAVMGLLPAGAAISSGAVAFDGQDLGDMAPKDLASMRGRKIAYVAQDPMVSLDPTFTVGSQIAEAVRTHAKCSRRVARQRSIELLELVHIPDAAQNARRYTHQLSGGMLQRCVIALALAGDPELLIADEPTTALDVTIQAEILSLFDELRRERGLAVLLITHDWGVVATAADRAIVMYAGEIVEMASVTQLFDEPQHPYTRALLASSPQNSNVGERLPAIAGSVPPPDAWPIGCRFAPRCAESEPVCLSGPITLRDLGEASCARCVHAEPSRRHTTRAEAGAKS